MTTRVLFHKVVQDEPAFGSTETLSVSRVYFELEVDGEMFNDLYVNVEEPVGSDHTPEEIQIGKLKDAPVSIDRQTFEQSVKSYYRGLVTSAGYGKHLAKGRGMRTQGDELALEQIVEL